MMIARSLILVLCINTALTGCNRGSSPAAAAAGAGAHGMASVAGSTQPVRHSEGEPEIATERDGVHIEYHLYGQGDPAVVLIHGWATDANYWNAQIAPLKSRYTVVTVDLAGHGASSRNRNDWSMERYGGDVATVVQQLPNRQVVLVGHSMGATVALEAARQLGERVIGIVAVDALKSIGLPPLRRAEIERRIAPFRTDFIGTTRQYVTESLFEKGANPLFVQKVAYDMSLEPPDVAVASLEALLGMDFASVLPAIHVPVMAINSDLLPTDERRIRRFLPDFTADVLPHTGHFLMMEDPQQFNPILLRDLDSLAQRAHR